MASESLFIISNSQPRGKYEVRYSKAVEQLTGKDIKKTVEKIISIPVANQILKFKNNVIGDNEHGSQHGIVNGDVIVVEQINTHVDQATVSSQPKAATAFATPPRVSGLGRPVSPQGVPSGSAYMGPRPMPAQPTQLTPGLVRPSSPVTPTRTRVAPFAPSGGSIVTARPAIPPPAVVTTPVRTQQALITQAAVPIPVPVHPPSPRASGYNQTALNSVSLIGEYVPPLPTEYIQRSAPRNLSPQRMQIVPSSGQMIPVLSTTLNSIPAGQLVQPLVANPAPPLLVQCAPLQPHSVPYVLQSPHSTQLNSTFVVQQTSTTNAMPQSVAPPLPSSPKPMSMQSTATNIVLPPPRAVQSPSSPVQSQTPPPYKSQQMVLPAPGIAMPILPEVTSFMSYFAEERPTVADFQTLVAQREHTLHLKLEHDALRQARDLDFLRTHKEFEELRIKSEMDVVNLDREIRERAEEIERLTNRQHRAMDSIYKLRQDRGVERTVEDQISRGLGQQMSVLTETAERIRSEELEMLQRKLREQTDFQTILGSERMRLERERREKRTHAVEIERELQRRVEDLELKESLLEKEWFDIQNRRAALEVVLPPSLLDVPRQPGGPPIPSFL